MNVSMLATNPWFRFAFYLVLVVTLRWDSLQAPLIGDSISYIMPTVYRMEREGLELWPTARYSGEAAYGHPFLVFHMLVLVHKLGLPPLVVSHGLILLFAAIALFATDRLACSLCGPAGGLAAGILLLVTPTFIAQAGLVRLAMPLTAFMLLALHRAVSNRWLAVAVFGSLAVLSKEPGVWLVPPLGILALFSGRGRTRFWRVVASGIPGVVFVLWMIGGKLMTGSWINRPGVRWEYMGPMLRCSELFSGDGRSYISILLFAAVLLTAWRERWRLRLLLFPFLVAAFWIMLPLLQGGIRYSPASLPAVSAGLTALLLGMGILWKAKESMLWGIVLVHLVVLTMLKETMPRYLLPALAVFLVLAVRAIWVLPRSIFRYVAMIPAVVLFVSQWHRGMEWFGNLGYRIELQGLSELARYMDTHLPTEKILYDGPGHIFVDSRYGFVDTPLDVYGGKGMPHLPAHVIPDVVLTTLSPPPGLKHRIVVEAEYIKALQRRWGARLRVEHEVKNERFRGRIYRVVRRSPPKRR